MAKLFPLVVSAILIAGCAHTADGPRPESLNCDPYAGTAELLDRAEGHVIFLGEMHGTNESPEALQQLACAALERGEAVRIGLEANWPQGAPLNEALREPFDEGAVFQAAPIMWTTPDGRGSGAILELLKHVAAWRADGLDVSVFAFDAVQEEWTATENSFSPRDAAMARHVDRQTEGFEGVVLVLAGGFHAQKALFDYADGTFTPMASLIRARPALSLKMLHSGGEAWVNAAIEEDDGSIVESVGPLSMSRNGNPEGPQRAFTLKSLPPQDFDGVYFTGPITASAPAFPLPE